MISEYLRERDAALTSLSKRSIVELIRKWQAKIPIPEDGNENSQEMFWRAVHKARVALGSLAPQDRAFSAAWLRKHNSSPLSGSPPTVEPDPEEYAAWESKLEWK